MMKTVSEFLAMDEVERSKFVAEDILGWCDGSLLCADPHRKAWLNNEVIPKLVYADKFNANTPEAMMQVVEKMRESGWCLVLSGYHDDKWDASFDNYGQDNEWGDKSFSSWQIVSAPLAVCIAAGLALGVLTED